MTDKEIVEHLAPCEAELAVIATLLMDLEYPSVAERVKIMRNSLELVIKKLEKKE